MSRIITCCFCWLTLQVAYTQDFSGYKFTVDLTTIVDDRVRVELLPPKINSNALELYFPKIIPGTYAIADYGRFITDVRAYDRKGRPVSVARQDENRWIISDARKLARITYWVDDLDDMKSGPPVYPMAGTHIEADKNVVINGAGFFGYFKEHQDLPIQIDVIRPEQFYGSTPLSTIQSGLQRQPLSPEPQTPKKNYPIDRYQVENYDRLIDSPILYAKPDTAVIRVANTEVLIGVYSPTGIINAKQIAATVRNVLQAQAKFLDGKLPVEKYAFLFNFTDKPVNPYGALEHWYSSFYFMPERPIAQMEQQLRDFAAHEFFHILTPLTIHSNEIHQFGFNEPRMSQHLWLYEGVTEYFAGLVQVQYGLLSQTQYLQLIHEKLVAADGFRDDLPFTQLSAHALDKFSDQYSNVYLKGAMIGMCLDIKLLTLSEGKYGLKQLLKDLGAKFGKDKPFEDEALFNEIVKLTYPQIDDFLKRYVAGPEPLPLDELFNSVGINYLPEVDGFAQSIGFTAQALSLIEVNGERKLCIKDENSLTQQGQQLAFKNGDVLISLNGKKIPNPSPALSEFFAQAEQELQPGADIVYEVLRKDEAGHHQRLELKAPIIRLPTVFTHQLDWVSDPTPQQKRIRQAWLNEK